MSLTTLPLEVVAWACEFASPQDVVNLRTTCRRLERATIDLFIKHHHRALALQPGPRGLETLRFLAHSENLRGSINVLCILARHDPSADVHDQRMFSQTLGKMLSCFPRLNTTGLYVPERGSSPAASLTALTVLLSALPITNIRPRHFSTCCLSNHSPVCGSLQLDPSDHATLQDTLQNVHSLHICSGPTVPSTGASRARSHHALEVIISATPQQLQDLSLNLAAECDARSAALSFRNIIPRIQQQHLVRLELCFVRTTSDDLRQSLAGSTSSLRSLKLSHVQMQKTRSAIESCVRWRSFFNYVRDTFALSYISLSCLGHAGIYWSFVDPLRKEKPATCEQYNAKVSWSHGDQAHTFRDWMDHIYFDVKPGDGYSTTIMESYAFGEDLQTDAWLQTCGLHTVS